VKNGRSNFDNTQYGCKLTGSGGRGQLGKREQALHKCIYPGLKGISQKVPNAQGCTCVQDAKDEIEKDDMDPAVLRLG
jgi:hypothetical protein